MVQKYINLVSHILQCKNHKWIQKIHSELVVVMDSDDTEQEKDWHTLPIKEVLEELHTSYDGLSEFEAENRLKEIGPNVIKSKEKKLYFLRYLNSFHGYLSIILLLTVLMSKILEN